MALISLPDLHSIPARKLIARHGSAGVGVLFFLYDQLSRLGEIAEEDLALLAPLCGEKEHEFAQKIVTLTELNFITIKAGKVFSKQVCKDIVNLQKKREKGAERAKRYRERASRVTSRGRNEVTLELETDPETDLDLKGSAEGKTTRKRNPKPKPPPPTFPPDAAPWPDSQSAVRLTPVQANVITKKYPDGEAEHLCDSITDYANRNPAWLADVRDWPARIRTWRRNENKRGNVFARHPHLGTGYFPLDVLRRNGGLGEH